MFDTIVELVTEAIGDCYDVEFKEALESELSKLVAVSGELYELREDSEFLNALRAAGVDNWEGYSYAQEIMEDE